MPEYLLSYSHPRASVSGGGIIYETRQLRAEHEGDPLAVKWAAETVPQEFGFMQRGRYRAALPLVLWRVDAGDRSLVWENARGSALLSRR